MSPWLRSTREPSAPRTSLRAEVDGLMGEEEKGTPVGLAPLS